MGFRSTERFETLEKFLDQAVETLERFLDQEVETVEKFVEQAVGRSSTRSALEQRMRCCLLYTSDAADE